MSEPQEARRLLDLTVEYAAAVESAASDYLGGVPAGRSLNEIAADYDRELRNLLGHPR
jgi:hypothetical protein